MTGLANDIMNKDTLYHLCDSHGVAAPKCWTKGADELMALEDELYFPCLIKPSKIHVVKTKMGGRKLWVIKNTTEYRAVVNSLPVGDTDWIVQEIIPGPESEIWLYTAYFDRESRPHQAFTARKTRQYPPGFGSASLVYSEENVELKSLCEDFFKKVSYEGIAAAELKRDPTDGILKMIEINPRPSLWFSLSTAAGKKITLAAYLNAQKQPPLAERAQLDGIQWRYWLKDMYSKIFYLLNPSFVLPPPEIKQHSTNTTRINAVYDPNDLLPLFGELQSVMRKALLRMIKKVASL
jgi:D-aspartate ligase